MPAPGPLVLVTREGPLAVLSLNRAERRNAIDASLLEALRAALAGVRDDPEVRAVLLRGEGPVFSSGIDHALLMTAFEKLRTTSFKHVHHDVQDVFNGIARMEKPVVAALHGVCLGMGLELALACDFRVAERGCVLGLPEVAFGLVPDVGGTTRLVRTVGLHHARLLVLTGRTVTARAAARIGLVTEVGADAADAERRARALCERLAAHPPAAVGMAKSLLDTAASVSTGVSLQIEGVVQNLLARDPAIAEHFPRALEFIKAQVKTPLDVEGEGEGAA
jgi:enoyl-CoA hydratase/carnithine racemase